MNTIAVYNTKGGVGKSAVTVFLADFLSTVHKKRVLLVDLDPQNSASGALLGVDALTEGFDEGKSLPLLLDKFMQDDPTEEEVRDCLLLRPDQTGRGKHSFLREVHLLACRRKDHQDLMEKLNIISKESRRNYYDLLARPMRLLKEDFDICLIDFPGSDTGIWAMLGLRAANWWLLPEIPDWLSVNDMEAPLEAVEEAQRNSRHRIHPLGTLLSICPNRGSNVYRRCRNALDRMAEENAAPKLFSKDAEILSRVEARSALDKNSAGARTLVKKYGGTTTPFYIGLRKLAKEVLDRMGMTYEKPPRLSSLGEFRRRLSDFWR